MGIILIVLIEIYTSYLSELPNRWSAPKIAIPADIQLAQQILPILQAGQESALKMNDLDLLLHQADSQLNPQVISKVLQTLECAAEYNIEHHDRLTIIDYSLPSNQKRLWVFDLKEKKRLFYTYVSHGIKSGSLISNSFSNRYNSKASSIGVYQTQQAYYGREGLSLRLDGLDRNFNDNASNRAVVMHPGWYVTEEFIKKYGRPGRSWGCPALPTDNAAAVINTIKDKSLLVIYYPDDDWFTQSKFLNCHLNKINRQPQRPTNTLSADEERDTILLVSTSKKNKKTDTKPVAVLSVAQYQQLFQKPIPLTRMLRRQVNHMEYIALSTAELTDLLRQPSAQELNKISFIIPVIKQVRGGYYETQMQLIDLGKIKEVKANPSLADQRGTSFTVYFENKPAINLTTSNQFIRWIGL